MWNSALEYLKKSRKAWWNNDYIEFLIEKVWKIKEPVSIVDFGCGIGFLGELLMPLLPAGSIYTGIDIGDKLLEEAERRFQQTGFSTRFIHADLNEYISKEKYDIAICQTVLQHIPNPIKILEKMKDSVKQNGMVVCIELSRDVDSASRYIDGLDYSRLNLLGIEQKLRRNALNTTGKDFEIGLKLPVYMEKLGLKNIDVRVNDYAQFVSPSKQEYKSEIEAFMSGNYSNRMTKEGKEGLMEYFISRGLTKEEAEHEFEGQLEISDYLYEHQEKAYIVNSKCMFISYGYNSEY
ncbi:MAG: Methyltransferase type 12 [Clostridiales bacterium]|nr:Methyltransferase type 12 [Clostridiales bacterium]